MREQFSVNLNDAEHERLALLLEELNEAGQAIGKILRHGKDSRHPSGGPTNIEALVKELGHVWYAIILMHEACDFHRLDIKQAALDKAEAIGRYLHFQPRNTLSKAAYSVRADIMDGDLAMHVTPERLPDREGVIRERIERYDSLPAVLRSYEVGVTGNYIEDCAYLLCELERVRRDHDTVTQGYAMLAKDSMRELEELRRENAKLREALKISEAKLSEMTEVAKELGFEKVEVKRELEECRRECEKLRKQRDQAKECGFFW